MGSTRLPGKVMKKVLGKPLLWHLIKRVERSYMTDMIIVATTKNKEDKVIMDLARRLGHKAFAGSEEDLLNRTSCAAAAHNVDLVIDITADCPLADPQIIDDLALEWVRGRGDIDYVCNVLPDTWPNGFGVQIYDYRTLLFLNGRVAVPFREHTGWNARDYPDILTIKDFPAPEDYTFPDWRVTVDTQEDFEVIEKIFEHFLHNEFSALEVIDFLREHPEITAINKDVKQSSMRGWKSKVIENIEEIYG
jgi:spore coat polysaccharide biosynthesis protein SpsF